MRLTELRLVRFGHFADAVLPLGEGLTLVYGANEAGKSTLLAALRALLFGFPRGASYDLRWPTDTLAIAGQLRLADGTAAELRREKRRGLRGQLGENALSDELLRTRLGRPSPTLFSTVFAFALEDLQRGGEALRDEGIKALVSAGVGTAQSPQALIGRLKDDAEALFTVKGRTGKPINAALSELKGLTHKLRTTQLRGPDYEARLAARDAARLEAQRLTQRQTALLGRLGQLQAIATALPLRDQLRGARAERATLSPPPLPPDAAARYEGELTRAAQLRAQAESLESKQAAIETELAAQAIDVALLQAAPRVRELHLARDRYAAAGKEAEALATLARQRRLALSARLAEVRRDWSPELIERLPPSLISQELPELRQAWSGQLERQRELDRTAAELAELTRQRSALRQRLDPPWPSSAPSRDLPVPRVEELTHQRTRLQAAERARSEARKEAERLRGRARQLADEAGRLETGGEVPSWAELLRLRSTRDALWSELERAWSPELARRFWAALSAADHYADELRRRSDEVARAAELAAQGRELAREEAEEAARLTQAEAELARAGADWEELWRRCDFSPHSPDAMLAWLKDYERLRDLERSRLQRGERLAQLERGREAFDAQLESLLRRLELDPALPSIAARRAVEVVLEVHPTLAALRADEARSAALAAQVASWRAEVGRLGRELAPAWADAEPAEVLRQLEEALRENQKRAQHVDHLRARLTELAQERSVCAGEQEAILEALRRWQARAQVTDDDSFLAAAATAQRAHALDQRIGELLGRLAQARGALEPNQFEEVLERSEGQVVTAELGRLREEQVEVAEALSAANQRLGAAQKTLEQLDDGAQVAELMAGVESQRARLRDDVAEYAVLVLARSLLERQVARFGERHQPRLLAELSSLFAALTEGRYRRVVSRLDDDGSFAVERADGLELAPAQLSTGTREQLWLAVRLAYIRTYCEKTEPLPLVLDDVLVNFDAARARAALAVLADFARLTQVLLLTCHAHLRPLVEPLGTVLTVPSA